MSRHSGWPLHLLLDVWIGGSPLSGWGDEEFFLDHLLASVVSLWEHLLVSGLVCRGGSFVAVLLPGNEKHWSGWHYCFDQLLSQTNIICQRYLMVHPVGQSMHNIMIIPCAPTKEARARQFWSPLLSQCTPFLLLWLGMHFLVRILLLQGHHQIPCSISIKDCAPGLLQHTACSKTINYPGPASWTSMLWDHHRLCFQSITT